MKIRFARPGDLPGLQAIETASFALPWTAAMLGEELPCTRVAVEKDDRLCGFGVFRVGVGEAEIFKIAVAPDRRQQGIGDQILRDLINHLRRQGVGKILLEVRVSNHAAIGLYKKAGFIEQGIRKRYYPDGEDALLMALPLAALSN